MARKRRRRIWEDDEKRRIVAQTRVPGVSVSQVARRYDVNANIVNGGAILGHGSGVIVVSRAV